MKIPELDIVRPRSSVTAPPFTFVVPVSSVVPLLICEPPNQLKVFVTRIVPVPASAPPVCLKNCGAHGVAADVFTLKLPPTSSKTPAPTAVVPTSRACAFVGPSKAMIVPPVAVENAPVWVPPPYRLSRPVLTVTEPPLFTAAAKIGTSSIGYDVAADGKRFVVVRTLAPRERRAVVVENWISRLEGAK